jgi:subtilase family serine protease
MRRNFLHWASLACVFLGGGVAAGQNIAINKPVSVVAGAPSGASLSTLTDGVFRPRGTAWQSGTIWWNSTATTIEIDLIEQYSVTGLVLQADDNDSYRVQYRRPADGVWVDAWVAPVSSGGGGMQTRPDPTNVNRVQQLAVPATTDRFRITAQSGDGSFSVSEFQAFGAALTQCTSEWRRVQIGARAYAPAVFDTLRGEAVLFGGTPQESLAVAMNDTWTRSGAASRWLSRDVIPPPGRTWHAMAFDESRQKLVLFGGQATVNFADTWEWDGTVWTRLSPANSPSARFGHSMAYDPAHQRVVLFGGFGGAGAGSRLNDTWTWDGVDWVQVSTSGPAPRYFGAMASIGELRGPLLVGGDTGATTSADVWEWTGTDWVQLPTPAVPAWGSRSRHAMAFDTARAKLVLFGGVGGASATYLADVWEWDGTGWLQRGGAGPAARAGHTMYFDTGINRVVAFGGSGSTGYGDVWEWDGTGWTDRSETVPSPRSQTAMVEVASTGRLMLFGGLTASGESNQTWELINGGWVLQAVTGPAARSGHAMVYDSGRQRVVLFGGAVFGSAAQDTHEWDGSQWIARNIPAAQSPSRRTGHAMAYDSQYQRTIVFGGVGTGLTADTWAFNGSTWSVLAAAGAGRPTLRNAPSMAYDPLRQQIVMFGGRGSGNTRFDETWVLENATWRLLSPAVRPTARSNAAFAFDATRGTLVLTGGAAASGLLSDTWEWNGVTWTSIPIAGPTPRQSASMAYETAAGRIVLFGGNAGVTSAVYVGSTWARNSSSQDAPAFSVQPASLAAATNEPLELTATVVNASTYRWRRNGQNLSDGPAPGGGTWSGTSTPVLRLSRAANADAGTYDMVAFNTCGATISSTATVTLSHGPDLVIGTLVAEPASGFDLDPLTVRWTVSNIGDRTVPAGSACQVFRSGVAPASAEVAVSGLLTLNEALAPGQSLPMEFATTLPLPSGSSGTYRFAVRADARPVQDVQELREDNNSLSSAIVTVNRFQNVGVVTQPSNVAVPVGGRAELSVGASGTGPLSYQWLRNATPVSDDSVISGSSTATLVIDPVRPTDVGNYSVRITNARGSIVSSTAALTLLVPPSFTLSPLSTTVQETRDAQFAVAASGNPVPTIRWYLGGIALSDNDRVSGSTTSTLTIRQVGPSDEGSYYAVATNSLGSVNSSSAVLTVGRVVLAVRQVTVASSACLGVPIEVSWDAVNPGTMPAASAWTDRVVLSRNEVLGDAEDLIVGQTQSGPVAPGATVRRSVQVTLGDGTASGNVYFFVLGDPTEQVLFNDRTESASLSGPCQVGSANLEVSSVSHPSTASVGGVLAVAWNDRNGGACASGNYSARVVLSRNQVLGDGDDSILATVPVTTLEPSQSGARNASVTIPSTAAVGPAFIFVQADPTRSVPHSVREDAEAMGPELIIGAPDLVVQSLTPPPNVLPNTSVQLAWSVANVGTEPAVGPWTESITGAGPPGSLPLGSFSVPAGFTLAPGQIVTRIQNVAVPGIPPGNGYTVTICADSGGAVPEAIEDNNCRTAPVCVDCAAPDLQPMAVAGPTSGQAYRGRAIGISMLARNAGNGAANGTWIDRVFLSADAILDASDLTLGEISIDGPVLSSSQYQRSTTMLIPGTVLPGEYYLILSVDATNTVSEPGNEANNLVASVARVRVEALPDLQLSGTLSVPNAATNGETVRVIYSARNSAPVNAGGPWLDRVYLSTNQTFEAGSDLPLFVASSPSVLAPDGTYNRELDVLLPIDYVSSGQRYLLLRLDDGLIVDEADEQNNVASAPITLAATPAADLAVNAVAAPAEASFGGTIRVSWTVANQGVVPAIGPWSDVAVLSLNTTFGDADDIALTPAIPGTAPLAVGGSYERLEAVFGIPARYGPQASYRVLVRTGDPANATPGEANRTNNVGVSDPVLMSPAPSANLTVTEIVPPASGVAGAAATLRWTVTNTGTGPVFGTWTDRVILRDPAGVVPDVELGVFAKSTTLPPTQAYTQQFAVSLPREIVGTRVFVITTDSGNAISEPAAGAEGDNSATSSPATSITLPDGPDLIVTSVSPLTSGGVFGSPISVQITVRNQGTQPATGGWSDRVLLQRDGASPGTDFPLEPLSPAVVTPLAPAAEYSAVVAVVPPVRNEFTDGAYRFVIRTDANGGVSEQRESNNEAQSAAFMLVRPTLPNLRVSFISVPAPALPGAPVTVTWTVVNAGGARAEGSWAERLYISSDASVGNDTLLSTIAINEPLDPGQTSTIRSRTIPVPSGGLSYRVVVCVDAGEAVVEASETDNCGVSLSDSTIERCDLTVRDVVGIPLNVMADDTITVSWVGENIGAAPTPGSFVELVSLVDVSSGVRHVLGSRLQSTQMLPGVPESRLETFDVPGRIEGEFRIEVTADTANAIFESVESNNTASSALDVTVSQPLRPNLVVSDVQLPLSGTVGSAASISFTVTNVGPVPATGTWVDRVVAKNAQTGTEQELAIVSHTGAVGAGNSYPVTATIRLPQEAGDYFLCVNTDSGDLINEGLLGGEIDNRRCSEAVFQSQTYLVTVVPSLTEGLAGTQVTVTGVATSTSGGPAIANIPVALSVSVRGTVRTYSDPVTLRTNAAGAYSFSLPLLPNEAGQYALRAGPPSNISPLVQSTFVLHGLKVASQANLPRIAPGAAAINRAFTVTNVGDLPLTGLTMTIAEAPAGLQITGGPSTTPLLGQEARAVNLAFTAAANALPASGPVRLVFTTTQGASSEVSFNAEIAQLAPELALVGSTNVQANMLVHAEGADPIQTSVELRIVNRGGSPTGPITVQLPSAYWLGLATPNPMASLAPGEEAAIVLTLTPGRNLLNADPRYPGTFQLRSSAPTLNVPFVFTAVPTATSSIIVRTEDEATFYKEDPPDPFPPVRGAFVRIVRPDGNIVMASGLSDQSGEVRFDGLPEGDYYVEASADKHQPWRELVAIRGSEPVRVYPFLSFNAISYSWTVDPIQIEDRYRFTLEAIFETNVPYPVVDITPRVIDLDDYADGQPHQINFTLTNRGLIRAQQVELAVGESSDWLITAINGDVGQLSPGQSVTVPAIIQRRPPACETCSGGAGCTPPVTRARHVVRCRSEQVLEQGVAYRLEPCGQPTGLGGGGGVVIVPPPGVRNPGGAPIVNRRGCSCVKVAVFFFGGGCGEERSSISEDGAIGTLLARLGKLPGCVRAFDVSGVRCPDEAREQARAQVEAIAEMNRQTGCCIEYPLVVTIGHSWGGETALNPVGIPNVRQIVVIDGINHQTAMNATSALNPACALAGLFACRSNFLCGNLLPELSNSDGSGPYPYGLDQQGGVAEVPAAAGDANIQNVRAGIADACSPDGNVVPELCFGSLSRGFNISGVAPVDIATATHCNVISTPEFVTAINRAMQEVFTEVPICPQEAPPCPPR